MGSSPVINAYTFRITHSASVGYTQSIPRESVVANAVIGKIPHAKELRGGSAGTVVDEGRMALGFS